MCTEITVENLLKNYFHLCNKRSVEIQDLHRMSLMLSEKLGSKVYVNMSSIGLRRALCRSRGVFQLRDNRIIYKGGVNAHFLNVGYEQDVVKAIQIIIWRYLAQKNRSSTGRTRHSGLFTRKRLSCSRKYTKAKVDGDYSPC